MVVRQAVRQVVSGRSLPMPVREALPFAPTLPMPVREALLSRSLPVFVREALLSRSLPVFVREAVPSAPALPAPRIRLVAHVGLVMVGRRAASVLPAPPGAVSPCSPQGRLQAAPSLLARTPLVSPGAAVPLRLARAAWPIGAARLALAWLARSGHDSKAYPFPDVSSS
jgi:hypothetical protein